MRRVSPRCVILLLAITSEHGLAMHCSNTSGSSITQETGRFNPANSAVSNGIHADAGEGCVVQIPAVGEYNWVPIFGGEILRTLASDLCYLCLTLLSPPLRATHVDELSRCFHNNGRVDYRCTQERREFGRC